MSTPTAPPPPRSDFSADDSILGFKYQLRYALYLFFDARRSNGLDVAIDVERIDDIDVLASNKLTKLVQTKKTATVLTNSSAPFWKTIRIWSEAIRRGDADPSTIGSFELVATSPNPAADSAIVNLLQNNTDQSRQTALSKMRSLAANNRTQSTLGTAYQAFHDLPSQQQEQLVGKIVIRTNAPTFDELDQLIYGQIVHGPPDKREAFGQVLFGCWDQLVETYLRNHDKVQIPWQNLQSLLHQISMQFAEDNLPIEFIGMLRAATLSISNDQRTFMRQLAAIGATDRQRQRAQLNHLKSTQLLSFWQRSLLLRPDEVLLHNKRLIEECEVQHETLEADPNLSGSAPETVGQRIYDWAVNTAPHKEGLRIRRSCIDLDVIRGCFHNLADGPQLGWHPNWSVLFSSSSSGS
jgi:hypothetical protein